PSEGGGTSSHGPMRTVARFTRIGYQLTASLSPLPARKAALVEAPILISLPVRGLRPVRASRLRVSKLPKPVIWTLSPLLSASAMMPVSAEKIASTAFWASDLLRFVRSTSFWVSSDLFTAGLLSKGRGNSRFLSTAAPSRATVGWSCNSVKRYSSEVDAFLRRTGPSGEQPPGAAGGPRDRARLSHRPPAVGGVPPCAGAGCPAGRRGVRVRLPARRRGRSAAHRGRAQLAAGVRHLSEQHARARGERADRTGGGGERDRGGRGRLRRPGAGGLVGLCAGAGLRLVGRPPARLPRPPR